MATFAIIAREDRPELAAAVQRVFPSSHYKFGPGQFVVATTQYTPQGVTVALQAGSGEYGSIVVMGVNGYWGFHDKALWEWLVARGTPS